jgi:KUP system potassium uptake protein
VVYGDIGTSPLYSMRESFEGTADIDVLRANILGVLSLIIWSLIVVISVKYLTFVMRADNDGEGGILALTALVRPDGLGRRTRGVLLLLGLFGTALLYGDGMITPAISVLGAMEGTEVATDRLTDLVVPITVAILVVLFAVQRRGTAAVGRVFGPVMLVWFSVIGVLGLFEVAVEPAVLEAFSPTHAVRFFADNGATGLLVLGSVFLVVTGGEALYADMGHFGRTPITVTWYLIVLPGLVANYLGQGALLLTEPEAIDNPFYRLAPSWGVLPLVVLATMASVIASQALISGAFSLTHQAQQLGYMPRMRVVHTSSEARGQVYVPVVNWSLMIASCTLVVGFGSTSNLAAAYGIAVTSTMAITTVLFAVVARQRFGWHKRWTLVFAALVLIIDLAFLSANVPKIPTGGWVTLTIGGLIFAFVVVWIRGQRLATVATDDQLVPLDDTIAVLASGRLNRVPGTAVFLHRTDGRTPPALMRLMQLGGSVHERIGIVSIVTADVPRVPPVYRSEITDEGAGVHVIRVRFGFTDEPDLPAVLERWLGPEKDTAVYVLGPRLVVVDPDRKGIRTWPDRLFALLHRNAATASDQFCLPEDRTITVSGPIGLAGHLGIVGLGAELEDTAP